MSDKIGRGYIFHSDFLEVPTFIKREDSISICGSENEDNIPEISADAEEEWGSVVKGESTSLQSIANENLRAKPDPLSINKEKQDDTASRPNLNKARNRTKHATKQRTIKETTIDSNKRTNRRRKTIKAVAQKEFKCSYCSKTFTRKQSLNCHENSHTGKQPHKCDLCPKTFTGSSALWNHIQTHTKDRQHKCSECEKFFLHKFQLDYHTREKHLPDTHPRRYFPCQLCTEKFKTNHLLHRHKGRMHSKNSTPTFTCDHCNREFKYRDKIVQHMNIHTRKKNYKCLHCNAKFAQMSGKWSHERFCLFK